MWCVGSELLRSRWIAVLRPDVQTGFSLDGKLLMDTIYDGDDWSIIIVGD